MRRGKKVGEGKGGSGSRSFSEKEETWGGGCGASIQGNIKRDIDSGSYYRGKKREGGLETCKTRSCEGASGGTEREGKGLTVGRI